MQRLLLARTGVVCRTTVQEQHSPGIPWVWRICSTLGLVPNDWFLKITFESRASPRDDHIIVPIWYQNRSYTTSTITLHRKYTVCDFRYVYIITITEIGPTTIILLYYFIRSRAPTLLISSLLDKYRVHRYVREFGIKQGQSRV